MTSKALNLARSRNTLGRMSDRLRTGLFQAPPTWNALKRTPPAAAAAKPHVPHLVFPEDKLYREVYSRLPVLKLEIIKQGDYTHIPLAQQIARAWSDLMTEQKMDKNDAFIAAYEQLEPQIDQFVATIHKARNIEELSTDPATKSPLYGTDGPEDEERDMRLPNFTEQMELNVDAELGVETKPFPYQTEFVEEPETWNDYLLYTALHEDALDIEEIPHPDDYDTIKLTKYVKLWNDCETWWNAPRPRESRQKLRVAKATFEKSLETMMVEEGATPADYLAYVLFKQIVQYRRKQLLLWRPFSDYISAELFEKAYTILRGPFDRHRRPAEGGMLPLIRDRDSQPMNVEQSTRYEQLLEAVQLHLLSERNLLDLGSVTEEEISKTMASVAAAYHEATTTQNLAAEAGLENTEWDVNLDELALSHEARVLLGEMLVGNIAVAKHQRKQQAQVAQAKEAKEEAKTKQAKASS